MEIINTKSITKRFGATTAVDRISVQVMRGEIYGFLGLNGAGKTTLIRMLLGMIKASSGTVNLFGKRLQSGFDQWNDIGYLVETPHAYPNLSVAENLKVYYRLRQLKDPSVVTAIMDKLQLTPYGDVKARYLSLGNQQRLGLAKALIHAPKLLILDEPINGLDPEGIVEVRNLLMDLVSAGSTVFLSSHILAEISKVANRIGIIHNGKLIKELATHELNSQLIKAIIVSTKDNLAGIKHLTESDYDARMNGNNEIEISDARGITHPENISQLLVEKGLPPTKLYLFEEDLEKYFLRTIRA